MNTKIPKRRFKGFSEDWKQEKLKNVVERVTRKNNGKTDLPLTISAQDGLVDQRHYFKRQVASKNMDNYILIKKGEYAYNKSYSKDYPFGAIKMLKKYDYGALSTLYIVFKATNISPRFLESYYESHYWHKEINKIAAEGARNHGLLNLSTQDFFKTNIKIPSTSDEQLKISNIVNQLDSLITLHKRKFKKLKQLQKSYLSESVFSEPKCVPKRRFKGFVEPWEQEKLGVICDFKVGGDVDKVKLLENGKYPVIANGKENEGIIGYYSDYRFSEGKVTVSGRGDVGYAKLRERPFTPVVRLIVISFSIIKGKFLELLINNLKIYNESTGVPQLTAPQLSTYSVSFPSQEEQLKISNMILYYEKLLTLHKHKRNVIKKLQKIYLQNNLKDETYA